MSSDIARILSSFDLSGELLSAGRYGSGLINDSFLCEYREGGSLRRYLLQRINTSVFTEPRLVMGNIELVTSHVSGKLRASGAPDPAALFPSLVPTRTGASFHADPSGSWRLFPFIETGEVFDTVLDGSHAFEVGRGLGMFQALVSDLSPAQLADTLPGFHHTPRYLKEYDSACRADPAGRLAGVREEAAFVDRHRALARLLMDPLESGAIPVRVVHNDPKVNNIMIDRKTGQALCMLDLDTVKPGIVHFDFGDCARSAANPGGEDAALEEVRFDLSLFEAVAGGYLQEAGGFLTRRETALLPVSVAVITYELGVRFLADHLRGDTYFRVGYPGQNLHRARVQFRLLESIERSEAAIRSLFT